MFFDEIDSIASQRGSSTWSSGDVMDNVVNQLLTEMQGIGKRCVCVGVVPLEFLSRLEVLTRWLGVGAGTTCSLWALPTSPATSIPLSHGLVGLTNPSKSACLTTRRASGSSVRASERRLWLGKCCVVCVLVSLCVWWVW